MKNNILIKRYINNFNLSGFVVIRRLINLQEIKKCEIEVNRISKILINKYKPPYVNFTKDHRLNTAHNLNKIFPRSYLMKIGKINLLKKILKGLFNEKHIIRNLEIFAKPAKTGLAAPFHQDNFYWNLKNEKAVNIWIALDKVNKNNGGLIYLKKSHKLGTLSHTVSNTPGSSQEIKKYKINKFKFIKVSPKLNPGDCIIHHCNVIHGSNVNKSNQKRRAIVISFKAEKTKIDKEKMSKYLLKLKKKLVS